MQDGPLGYSRESMRGRREAVRGGNLLGASCKVGSDPAEKMREEAERGQGVENRSVEDTIKGFLQVREDSASRFAIV